MKIQDLKVGDYVITHKELYVVMDIHVDINGTYYDLKGYRDGSCTKAVPRNRLRHADKLISKNKLSEKMLKILYG